MTGSGHGRARWGRFLTLSGFGAGLGLTLIVIVGLLSVAGVGVVPLSMIPLP